MSNKIKKKAKVKAVSFDQENFDVLEYLKRQDNASKYICRLIRYDMDCISLENRVEHIVNKILAKSNIKNDNTSNKEYVMAQLIDYL